MRLQIRAGSALLIVGAVFVVGGCGGHSESWQYGYDNAGSAANLVTSGLSDESACRSISGAGAAQGGFDRGEVIEGCLAALADGE